MTQVVLSPLFNGQQFLKNDGSVLAGGKIRTCLAGSFTTNQDTYSTAAGDMPNPGEITLNSAGRLPVDIWLKQGAAYNLILTDSLGNVLDSVDNVQGGVGGTGTGSSVVTTETITTTQNQTVIPLANPYTLGAGAIDVFVNGAKQVSAVDYTETSANSITFTSGLNAGDVVHVKVFSTSLFASPNASTIQYNQGGTGASTRFLSSKLQEVVSVKDFGAIGDGTHDDTSALQSALDFAAANKAVVFVPHGTYKFTSALTVAGTVSGIYGDGLGSSLNPTNCDGLIFTNQPSYAGSRFVRDFFLEGTNCGTKTGLTANMSAVSGNRITGVQFQNLTIQNFGTAVFMRGLWASSFMDCFLYNNYQGYYFHGQSITNRIEGGYVQKGSITGTGTQYGILIDSVDGESCQSLHIIQNNTYGYDVNIAIGLALYTVIENCDISIPNQYGVQITTTSGGTIVRDSWIQTNSSSFATVGIQIDNLGTAAYDKVIIDSNTLVCNLSNANSTGIFVGSNQQGVILTNNTIGRNGGEFNTGILNNGANNTVSKNNTIYATTSAVYVNASPTNLEIGPNTVLHGTSLVFATGGTPPGLMYYDKGTFTITLTGMSSTINGNVNWVANGHTVTLFTSTSINGTSNSTSMTGTGLPVVLYPSGSDRSVPGFRVNNAGVSYYGNADISATTGLINFYTTPDNGAFTNSGTKGLKTFTATYAYG